MARLIKRLTETKIRTLVTQVGQHHDGGGLYLQVKSPGAASWVKRLRLNGVERYMGLGSLADVGLVKVREKAAAADALIAQGIDPIKHTRTHPFPLCPSHGTVHHSRNAPSSIWSISSNIAVPNSTVGLGVKLF